MSNPQPANGKTKRVAYTVVDRGEGKSFWLRVGTAFENRDGSLNVYLDAIPVNGRLQIREYQPDDERDSNHGRGGSTGAGTGGANAGNGDRQAARRPNNARTG
jgi:hypothetical protein